MPPKILVIAGPTASGKTRLSIELALSHNGEVVSADSMQIYRGMDIGTAKPTAQERRGVPHHMLDVADPSQSFSVACYVEQAAQCIDDILARGRLPILAGGTGLYLDSLLSGRTFAAVTSEHPLREQLQQRMTTQGAQAMLEELAQVDPDSAARLHPNDEKRIIRALEVWHGTGRSITWHNGQTRAIPPRYQALHLYLAFQNRADMWRVIDQRVDNMMEAGLVAEVTALLATGIGMDATAMQAIGYRELAHALNTNSSIDEAVSLIKLRSRQYAKRQLTWFRRNQTAKWMLWENMPDFILAARDSTRFMQEFGLV